jgi:tetratricopeptide (TPR) repeat protein
MPDREERLDEAAAAYLEAVENGQRPQREEWLARYPDLADELAQFIDDQEKVQRWTDPIRPAPGRDLLAGAAGSDPLATLHVSGGSAAKAAPQFPNYQLLGEIARGGMGIVFRARQLNPSRIVALKMILAGPHASSAELYRFRMETEAAASLDHPNIMPIYEVSDQDGRPFFSMKLMEGGSLAGHLPRFAEGRAAAALLIKVARAVHHAHVRGILHRDLKPANVLLDAQGEPFVTDFGLCRRVEVDSGMTQSGVIVGTPSYMSPEQAAGRKGLTTATDVYSLGAILYTLLTDRPPFKGNTPLETVRGVLEDEPSRPRLLRPQVDRDLETICLKCLDKQPARRYASAESLADDLSRWLNGEPIVARRSTLWERAWKRTRRNPAAAALVAVSSLALVFLIAAGVLYQSHRLRVAEESLARVTRVAQWQAKASGNINQATAFLKGQDAENARLHANLAIEQATNEPELAGLVSQATRLLAQAERQIQLASDRDEATASIRRFEALRDDVLFYGFQTASELPENWQAAQQAGVAAFQQIGLSADGEGTWRLSSVLSPDQRRALDASRYELLIVLADLSSRLDPPERERAARLKIRADALHVSLATTTAQEHFLSGYEARRKGDVSAAIAELSRAVRSDPTHVWARLLLAACHLQTNPGAAEVHLSVLLEQRPDHYWAYLLRGIAHANLNEIESAGEDFSQALALAPAREHATGFRYATLTFRGNLQTLRGNFPAAEEDLLEAIRLQPDAHVARMYLAQAYDLQKRPQEAAQHLDKALAAGDLTPRIEAGILYFRSTRTTAAAARRSDLERSIALFPYAEALFEQAGDLLRRSSRSTTDLENALVCCDQALAAPAYSPQTYVVGQTHYRRAVALVELGRQGDAAAAVEHYLADGGKPIAQMHRLRSMIQTMRKDFPGAILALTEALRLDPSDADLLADRGSAYLAIGAWNPALDDFQAALTTQNDNVAALAGRAVVRAVKGDDAGAESDAEQALAAAEPTQRITWLAARSFALVYGRLASRGQFVSLEESKEKVRYRNRALILLQQALDLTAPEQRPAFWQAAVEQDAWFGLLREHPQYGELKRKYAPTAPEPKDEL